jgi:amino-acid N-acetyltransferase
MTDTQVKEIRKARVIDVPAIADIVNAHAAVGIMLQRPLTRIYDNVRDYVVVEVDGDIVACGALHVMWSDLAEIRALAVKKEYHGKGFGRAIVENLLDEAADLAIEKVFVLTYRDTFFKRLGFDYIDKSELPHKIWNECVNCVHFPNCDEIAMIRHTTQEKISDGEAER